MHLQANFTKKNIDFLPFFVERVAYITKKQYLCINNEKTIIVMRNKSVCLLAIEGIIVLFVAIILSACDKYDLKKRIVRFEQEMEEYRVQTDNIGLSVVFVKDNKVAYTRQWGLKSIESEEILPDSTWIRTGEPLTGDAMMRCASISKTFCATGLMQLVEMGKLGLRMDIGDILDSVIRNPLFPNTPITLEMLMSHTSSINDSECYNDYEPGHGYQYCDHNYTLGGMILEKVSGERFDEYVKHHILLPLGITGGFNVDSVDHTMLASLYQWETNHYVCRDEDAYAPRGDKLNNYRLGKDTYLFSPAAGMKISAKDLTKYMLMHMNYGLYVDENGDLVRILAESTSRNMQTPRSYEGDEHFGLGLLETEMFSPGTVLVGHCAGAYGMRGVMHFNPKEKYGFIVMSNGSHDSSQDDENMVHFGTIRKMFQCFIAE